MRLKATAKPRRARRVRTAGRVKICSTRLIDDAGHLGMHFIGREEAEPFALRFRLLDEALNAARSASARCSRLAAAATTSARPDSDRQRRLRSRNAQVPADGHGVHAAIISKGGLY